MATQEISGWWILTTTTKVGSVQPTVLGGATGPLGGVKTTAGTPKVHNLLNWHSSWLRPRLPSSPAVSRAMCYLYRWRVEVRVPLAWSVRIVPLHNSVLEHFPVRRGFAAVLAANWSS